MILSITGTSASTSNILDWGKFKRLKEIQHALDELQEESRKITAEATETHVPPFDSASSSGHANRTTSSSYGNGSRFDTAEDQSGMESCWTHNDTAYPGFAGRPSYPSGL